MQDTGKGMKRLSFIDLHLSPPICNTFKDVLSNPLFSVTPINREVDRDILSLAYSPGVGAICMEIVKQLSAVNTMTLRGRSVAIVVSDGAFLGIEGSRIGPVLDWFIVQIKYYAGIDAYPFILRKQASINSVLSDLSTCYSMVLLLDEEPANDIVVPETIALILQTAVSALSKSEKSNGRLTAKVISHVLRNHLLGMISEEVMNKAKEEEVICMKGKSEYVVDPNDGKDLRERAIQMHQLFNGKIQVQLNIFNLKHLESLFNDDNFKQCLNQELLPSKTSQLNAIVTDGTAILGFGNIGPEAGLPVMEGKSLLFKLLGDVDVVPVCIKKRETVDESIKAILDLLSFYQGINLEDFAAPNCFAIEKNLSALNMMPIFHDDQHGTAIVTLAALINALRLTDKNIKDIKIIINGAGAAGLTIAKLLLKYGAKRMIVCDRKGAIYKNRGVNMNPEKQHIAEITNQEEEKGQLMNVLKDSDVFIGVSSKNVFAKEWVKFMKDKPIIFAMANPDPEITFTDAIEGGAYVYGSGRSDVQNQINNSLVFPGIFKAINQHHHIRKITMQMKVVAAEVIAKSLKGQPRVDYIIPDSLDREIPLKISQALGKMQKI